MLKKQVSPNIYDALCEICSSNIVLVKFCFDLLIFFVELNNRSVVCIVSSVV